MFICSHLLFGSFDLKKQSVCTLSCLDILVSEFGFAEVVIFFEFMRISSSWVAKLVMCLYEGEGDILIDLSNWYSMAK